jgi:hypothetical protein
VPSYDERLRVPWWWWLVGGTLVAGVFVVYLVWTPLWVAAIVGVVLLAIVMLGLYAYGSARVRVSEQGLQAGRAVVPASSIGEVRPIDAQGRRRLLGPEADARAHTLVRGYIPGGVQVRMICDTTPYWFVSSRHPEALAGSLTGVGKRTR